MNIEKILIIEDEELFVKSLSRKLTKLGFNVDSFLDGKGAFEKALSFLPDLILLDVKLPNISGIKVCKRLKTDRRTKNIPVIMLSALTQPIDIQEGYAAGADDYMRKPLMFPDLAAVLEAWEKK